jgi:hypothetical protein
MMQAVGVVNDHLAACFVRDEVRPYAASSERSVGSCRSSTAS